jgi:Nucleoside 2-deoxyribosyltransferase like
MMIRITSAAEVKAPNGYPKDAFTIFLGGVIDQGKSENWQNLVCEELKDYDVLILNPRRDAWDASWEQSIDNPEFVEQVEWELDSQENSDICLYVFGANEKAAKEAKAPITLMELGLFSKKDSMVCCPTGYERKGNVDIVCRRCGIPVYESLDELLSDLKELITNK